MFSSFLQSLMGRKNTPPAVPVGDAQSPPLAIRTKTPPIQLPLDLSIDPLHEKGAWDSSLDEETRCDSRRLYLTKAECLMIEGMTVLLVRLIAPFGSNMLETTLHQKVVDIARQVTKRGRQYVGLSYAFPNPLAHERRRVKVLAFVRVEKGPFTVTPVDISDFQLIDRDRVLVRQEFSCLILRREDLIPLIAGVTPQVSASHHIVIEEDVRFSASYGGGGYIKNGHHITIGDDFSHVACTPLSDLGLKNEAEARALFVTGAGTSLFGYTTHDIAYRRDTIGY